MKVLMIGGTGTISMAITRLLCQSGWEVYLRLPARGNARPCSLDSGGYEQ